MTIILANSRITSTFNKPSDQVSPASPSSESREEFAINFAVKRNSANPENEEDSSSSAPDFDLVIPFSSIANSPLEVAVMEMNDKEHQHSIVNNNNNKNLSCDQISEINNNHTFKMGVKYHTFNNLLHGEEDDPRSMSPKVLQDIMGAQQKNRNNCVNLNRSNDRKLDNNNTAEVSMVVDNNNSITTTGNMMAEEDTEDDDCGGDNESVLSVGRDEANFDDLNRGDDDDEEDDGNEADKPPRINNIAVEQQQQQQNGTGRLQKPIAVPFESSTSNEKLNLGLSFRNIHNHLTSLKNYSPFDVFSVAAAATVNPLWKNSAFQAAATPTPFQGVSAMNPHHTVELLHHYDMLRNANLTNRPAGSAPHQNGRRDFHDESLKFSIDNILKADFGRRRITDPINKLRKISNTIRHSSFAMSPTSTTSNSSSSSPPVLRSPPPQESPRKLFSPVDLTGSCATSTKAESERSTPAAAAASVSGESRTVKESAVKGGNGTPMVWPAWVYCTRYSDRPSSGRSPRTKKPKKQPGDKTASNGSSAMSMSAIGLGGGGMGSTSSSSSAVTANAAVSPLSAASSQSVNSPDSSCSNANDDKRPRTAFSGPQLARLKHEFNENRYLTEKRRQQLSAELGLNEAQIKIWFQNKRAKIKKSTGQKNPLALQLMAQGLYNHSTIPLTKEEEKLQDLQHSQQEAAAASASSM